MNDLDGVMDPNSTDGSAKPTHFNPRAREFLSLTSPRVPSPAGSRGAFYRFPIENELFDAPEGEEDGYPKSLRNPNGAPAFHPFPITTNNQGAVNSFPATAYQGPADFAVTHEHSYPSAPIFHRGPPTGFEPLPSVPETEAFSQDSFAVRAATWSAPPFQGQLAGGFQPTPVSQARPNVRLSNVPGLAAHLRRPSVFQGMCENQGSAPPPVPKPTRPDPNHQVSYEAFIEWKKQNQPGYAQECRLRQQRRTQRVMDRTKTSGFRNFN